MVDFVTWEYRGTVAEKGESEEEKMKCTSKTWDKNKNQTGLFCWRELRDKTDAELVLHHHQ